MGFEFLRRSYPNGRPPPFLSPARCTWRDPSRHSPGWSSPDSGPVLLRALETSIQPLSSCPSPRRRLPLLLGDAGLSPPRSATVRVVGTEACRALGVLHLRIQAPVCAGRGLTSACSCRDAAHFNQPLVVSCTGVLRFKRAAGGGPAAEAQSVSRQHAAE